MQLEPGPIPQLAPDTKSLEAGQAEFEDLVNSTLADLPGLDDDLGGMMAAFDAFDVPPEFDLIDLQLDTADEGLNEISAIPTAVHVASASDAVDVGQEQIQLTMAEAPAEVWQPTPAPQSNSAGTPTHPGENGPTYMQLENVTRPQDSTFYSGDSYTLTVHIDSGSGNFDFGGKPLSLTRTHNGADAGELPLGNTDIYGRLVFRATWTDADVGDWVFGVDPPGYGTNPQVSVHVNAGPAPGAGGTSGQSLNFTLTNLSSGDASTLHLGDVWRETITGPPNQPVYLRQIKDGVDQGEIFVGSTDANGALSFTGQITAAQVGGYVETVRVGTVNVPTQLTFTVVP